MRKVSQIVSVATTVLAQMPMTRLAAVDMELKLGAADGAAPHRGERPQHRFGVSDAAQRAHDAAHQRQRDAFDQQQAPHLLRRQTQRQQGPDFGGALFEPELKEQRHQQQRGHDQEEAEPEKELAEVLRLAPPT